MMMCAYPAYGADEQFYGGAFALPNMGEKGYMDIKVRLDDPSGC